MRRIIRDRGVLAFALGSVLEAGAKLVVEQIAAGCRPPRNRAANRTLRPGSETPMWNELLKLLRPQLKRRGAKSLLGRMLGLSRQRVHALVTRGTTMPDAERTLILLAWLAAKDRVPLGTQPVEAPRRVNSRRRPSGFVT